MADPMTMTDAELVREFNELKATDNLDGLSEIGEMRLDAIEAEREYRRDNHSSPVRKGES